MNKKTQTVGRPPAPYPHPWEHFWEALAVLIADFNGKAMGGQWENRLPMSWLAAEVEAGWRPVRAELLAIDSALCRIETRLVRDGVVQIEAQRDRARSPLWGVPRGGSQGANLY